MVNIKKRGNVYQYQFEIAPVDGKRKYINKSGFKSKREAMEAGVKAYNEYFETGHSFKPSTMSYSDYLDYWLKNYCYVNLKYHTIQAYSNIIKNHIKPRLGFYRLSQIQTSTLQEVVNAIYLEKGFSKNFMHNILKVLKGSFKYANESAQFIKDNPAVKVTMPKYDEPEKDPAHIFTAEEIKMILICKIVFELVEDDKIKEKCKDMLEDFKATIKDEIGFLNYIYYRQGFKMGTNVIKDCLINNKN